jgi:plastocyanin
MRRIAVLLGACLALAGCGGGGGKSSQGSATGAPQQTVSISEKEYSLSPSAAKVGSPGTVAFKVTNNGQIAHALEIEGNGVEEETDTIQPGQSATLTVKLSKAGSYEMYCPIDGHKDKGMKGEITVGGSAGSGGTTTTQGTTTNKGPGY